MKPWRAAVAASLLWASAAPASAPFDPALVAALDRLAEAEGPEQLVALHQIWRTWERADPGAVEAALDAARSDTHLTPAARSYAGALGGYARLRRGDLAGSRRRFEELGYVSRWLVVGPFDNEGKAGFGLVFEPEQQLGAVIAAGSSFPGKERAVAWRLAPSVFPYGYLDLDALLRPAEKICAYAATFVSAREGQKAPASVALWVGAGGAVRLWWNGAPVLEDAAYRGVDADRRAALVPLRPGVNQLTAKVCSDEGAPLLAVRLGDARGGPEPRVEARADFALAEAAARNHTAVERAKPAAPPTPAPAAPPPAPTTSAAGAAPPAPADPGKAGAAPPRRRPAEGALDAFERLTAGKKPAARHLHAFAEYLVATGGDDPVTHQARDLARRAAEAEPTVDRLLLAGGLAEDRNKAREWIEQAAARAGAPHRDVLLAQAALARSGPDSRTGMPFITQALQLDPDDGEALEVRVELLNAAGLRQSALEEIERAVARQPHRVQLLRLLSAQLRAVGQTTRADEVESRWAAYRHDDRTYLTRRLDRAVARRDRAEAERWVARLLELDPESQWAHGVAASTYRALGQPERAVAALERALSFAPEDVDTLRALADLQGQRGAGAEQLALLRRILQLRPQDREVREYVEHIEPPRPRDDEAWAWEPERFLALRAAPAAGQVQRTLRDLQVTTVYPSGLSARFRQLVFQPLNDTTAAAGRQYAFQYQADREVVQMRAARVFRKDGRIDEAVEVGEGAADNPSIAMYTSARTQYVQLPRLEPGDVVELQYRVDEVTPTNVFGDYYGDLAYLSTAHPVQNAEVVLVTPRTRTVGIETLLPGLRHETRDDGDRRIHRWFAAALPATPSEPGMPPWGELGAAVHASTFRTWQDMGAWYWNLAREQFDLDDETRKLAREIGAGATTDEQKVKQVFAWVIKNTRYVALEFGIHGFKPRRCVQTVARGWGDCKDKATAIVTLLEELGVPATIVIVRTQMRGDLTTQLASLAPFDHAIAYVPSLDLYLDGTAELAGIRELPTMDLGALALRVNRGQGAELVRLPGHDPAANVLTSRWEVALAPGGSATVHASFETRGVEAPRWRARYQAAGTRRERVETDLGSLHPGFKLGAGPAALEAPTLDDTERPVVLSAQGTAPTLARREGATLSLAVTPAERLTPSFASLSRRTQDVRILAFSTRDVTYQVKLPPGARVASLPTAAAADGRFGSYQVEVSQAAGVVTVRTRIAVKVMRITPAEYPEWQRFCADVDAALEPRLVVQP